MDYGRTVGRFRTSLNGGESDLRIKQVIVQNSRAVSRQQTALNGGEGDLRYGIDDDERISITVCNFPS